MRSCRVEFYEEGRLPGDRTRGASAIVPWGAMVDDDGNGIGGRDCIGLYWIG